jgi:regulation of enolase protein 1 (concanavalin A-like superfamily)
LRAEADRGWEGFRWLNEPRVWRVENGRLALRCSGESDFWRHTDTGHVQHDGNVFGCDFPADFSIEVRLEADLSSAYDQLGVIAIASEEMWLKASVELDGPLWLGAVHTRGHSDWSREPIEALPATIRLARVGGTVTVSVQEGDSWRLIRLLTLEGGLFVGPYACAPSGTGFEARIDLLRFTPFADSES